MPINLEKAKNALAALQAEKQAQQHRLQLAAEAKQRIDNNNAFRTQSLHKRWSIENRHSFLRLERQ